MTATFVALTSDCYIMSIDIRYGPTTHAIINNATFPFAALHVTLRGVVYEIILKFTCSRHGALYELIHDHASDRHFHRFHRLKLKMRAPAVVPE